jgi:hypothetical protein
MPETAGDEQDLAKALDSVASSLDGATPLTGGSDDTKSDDTTAGATPAAATDTPDPLDEPVPSRQFPSITPVHDSNDNLYPKPLDPLGAPAGSAAPVAAAVDSGPLADIKKDALTELRPLVDKLNVSPEEKFDTFLLLIRSTDDSSLIGPAHDAAKAITDETRRAEALLDIIKEIDYLSHQNKA